MIEFISSALPPHIPFGIPVGTIRKEIHNMEKLEKKIRRKLIYQLIGFLVIVIVLLVVYFL